MISHVCGLNATPGSPFPPLSTLKKRKKETSEKATHSKFQWTVGSN